MTCYRCHETGHFHHACPMRQRTGEKWNDATATTWADIAAQGVGDTQRAREEVDEWERRRTQTECEGKESEKMGGIQTEELKSRHQGGQEQRLISEQEETDRRHNMEFVTPQISKTIHTTVNQMEYEGVGQEEVIKVTTDGEPNTQQHVPYGGDQSAGEEEGKKEEQVLEERGIEGGISVPKDTEGLNFRGDSYRGGHLSSQGYRGPEF